MDAATEELHQEKNVQVENQFEELTIRMRSSHVDPSSMSEELKREYQKDAPLMSELFEETLRSKGEYDPSRIKWIEDNEVEVNGLSKMTLHNFLLRAEALGKDITYTKQTTISIS